MARSSRGESAVERGFGTDDTLDRLVCDSRSFGPASSAESERNARAPRAARGTSPAPKKKPRQPMQTHPRHNVAMTTMSHKPKKISRTKISRVYLLARVESRTSFGVWVQLSQIQLSSAIQPSRESPPHARSSAPCWPWDGRRYLEEGSDDASRRRGPGARRRRPDPSGRGARATSFRSVP